MAKRDRKRKNPFGCCGRPHKGLVNPELYGLTYEQVVNLIENGEWRNFYKRWHKKNRSPIENITTKIPHCVNSSKITRRCTICQMRIVNQQFITFQNNYYCEACIRKITDDARGKTNSKTTEGDAEIRLSFP